MRFRFAVLVVGLGLGVPAVARANCVPKGLDVLSGPKTKVWYVLPGPYGAIVQRAAVLEDRNQGVGDFGIEISAHRFVAEPDLKSFFGLAGYGAVLQLSLGTPLTESRTPDALGPTGRIALGGQTTSGPFGLTAGLQTRLGSPDYASTFGAFFGGFVSLGVMSGGVQFEAPIASLSGEGRLVPWLVTFPATFKWPIALD